MAIFSPLFNDCNCRLTRNNRPQILYDAGAESLKFREIPQIKTERMFCLKQQFTTAGGKVVHFLTLRKTLQGLGKHFFAIFPLCGSLNERYPERVLLRRTKAVGAV